MKLGHRFTEGVWDYALWIPFRPANLVLKDLTLHFDVGRLKVDVCCRLEGAQEAAAAAQRAGRDWPPSAMGQPPNQPVKGPSSLFLLSEDNPLRRYTRFIIEWPYPFIRNVQHFKLCRILYKTLTTYLDVKF